MPSPQPPFGHALSGACRFYDGILDRQCRHAPIEGLSFCDYHIDLRCSCGEQATHTCGTDFCTTPLCEQCDLDHRFTAHHTFVIEY